MSPCQGCHAGCCRSFAIPVTGADIIRIQRDSRLEFWDFVYRWADPQGMIVRNYAPHFFFQDEPETPFAICLKQVDSDHLHNIPKCLFLKEEAPTKEHPLGTASCGNYENRPAACRVFPTKMSDTGELPVIVDVPERSREDSTHPAFNLCPRPWEPSDLDSLQVMQDIAVARAEMNFFKNVANLWNRNPGDWKLFPEFLQIVYETRLVCERDLVPQKTTTETDPKILKMPGVEDREKRAA